MVKTIYIVNRIEFEYNDEVNRATENDAGNPVIAYKTREEANQALDFLNHKTLLETTPAHYGYEPEEVFIDVAVSDAFLAKHGINWTIEKFFEKDYDFKFLIGHLSREEQKEFFSNVDLNFFVIREVDLHESTVEIGFDQARILSVPGV